MKVCVIENICAISMSDTMDVNAINVVCAMKVYVIENVCAFSMNVNEINVVCAIKVYVFMIVCMWKVYEFRIFVLSICI